MTMSTNDPATEMAIEPKAPEALSALWWMPLIRGILLILFGFLMFMQPGSTVLNLIWFMGIYWVVDGIFNLIEGFQGHTEKSRTWMVIGGIASILAGLFIIGNPLVAGLVSGTFLAYLIGISTIVTGIMMFFAGRNGTWTWSSLIMGILYVIFGIFVMANPIIVLATLVWLLSIWAIVAGVFVIWFAFQLRGTAN